MSVASSSSAFAIAIASLLISFFSFLFTMRTYVMAHRPYLGITVQNYRSVGDPPSRFEWRFVVKNTGSLPAWGKIEEYQVFLTTEGRTTALPVPDQPDIGIFLMPDDTADITGQLSDFRSMARLGNAG